MRYLKKKNQSVMAFSFVLLCHWVNIYRYFEDISILFKAGNYQTTQLNIRQYFSLQQQYCENPRLRCVKILRYFPTDVSCSLFSVQFIPLHINVLCIVLLEMVGRIAQSV